jgi:transposase-like protein
MAAEVLASESIPVTIIDHMAAPARKFLLAGRGGLNLTHSEPLEQFLTRYGEAQAFLEPAIRAFPPDALIAWANGLGIETFVGTSGRVFPKQMKASPLLRAWLRRLDGLGVTLKTAWFMSHRIRMAMSAGGSRGPMGGAGKVVEVDETYFGKVENETDVRADGKPMKKKGRGTGGSLRNRRAVVALIERGGSARTFHVAEANLETVSRILRENVDPQSKLHTDGHTMYRRIGKEFSEHKFVDHSRDEYVRYEETGVVHNNSAESYFSVFKRGMKGVYQHCSEKHLHRYLAEFEYRFNTRVALGVDDEQRAETALAQVVGKRLTYKAADRPA